MRERQRIDAGTDERYVRRDDQGHFTRDHADVGRSSAGDQRRHSDTPPPRGQGDRGDRQSPKS